MEIDRKAICESCEVYRPEEQGIAYTERGMSCRYLSEDDTKSGSIRADIRTRYYFPPLFAPALAPPVEALAPPPLAALLVFVAAADWARAGNEFLPVE